MVCSEFRKTGQQQGGLCTSNSFKCYLPTGNFRVIILDLNAVHYFKYWRLSFETQPISKHTLYFLVINFSLATNVNFQALLFIYFPSLSGNLSSV